VCGIAAAIMAPRQCGPSPPGPGSTEVGFGVQVRLSTSCRGCLKTECDEATLTRLGPSPDPTRGSDRRGGARTQLMAERASLGTHAPRAAGGSTRHRRGGPADRTRRHLAGPAGRCRCPHELVRAQPGTVPDRVLQRALGPHRLTASFGHRGGGMGRFRIMRQRETPRPEPGRDALAGAVRPGGTRSTWRLPYRRSRQGWSEKRR
jgi:hypothetical protein